MASISDTLPDDENNRDDACCRSLRKRAAWAEDPRPDPRSNGDECDHEQDDQQAHETMHRASLQHIRDPGSHDIADIVSPRPL